MRVFSNLVVALTLVSLMGCASQVGIINPTRLFEESDSGKSAIMHIEKMDATIQEQLVEAQQALQAKPNDEALREHLQTVFMGYQEMTTAERQKVLGEVNVQMAESLDAYRKENNITVIMNHESVLSYDEAADITDDVIAKMNQNPMTFAPVEIAPLKLK